MKHRKWVQFSVVMCALILPLFGALSSVRVSAAPVVITFDDGLVKDKDIVTTQYVQKFGVLFNGPTARDYSPFGPNFAHSGYMAIEQQCGEFCVSPIVMNFTYAQTRVKVWVGFSAALDMNRTVILGALDNNGSPIGTATVALIESSQPIPIQTPLEVIVPTANIKAAYVGFSDNTNKVWNNLAVDDVEFEGPTTQATSTTGIADFLITSSRSNVALTQGSTSAATITLTSLNGFSSNISLSASWVEFVPTGIAFGFVPLVAVPPAGGNATSTLTLSAAADASTGNFVLQVTGTRGTIAHTTGINVRVTATGVSTNTATTSTSGVPDFSVSSSPSTFTFAQGSNRTVTITVTPLNGLNSPVDFSWSWVESAPTHVSISFSSNTIGGVNGGLLTIAAGSSSSTGNFTLRITGKSGTISHSVDVSIEMIPISISTFGVDIFPLGVSLCANYAGRNLKYYDYSTALITVHSVGTFSSPVTLSSDPVPVGFVLSVNPLTVVPAAGGDAPSVLTMSVTSNQVPVGDYVFTIHATSGQLSQDITISVHVDTCRGPAAATITSSSTTASATNTASTTPPPGGCALATAIAGSELAPLAQSLRSFRDGSIQKTRAGSQFLAAFNAWYYSFSPYIAYYIALHPLERTIAKDLSYPLLGILYGAYYSYTVVAPLSTEAAAVAAGIVAALLIGLVYVAPIGYLTMRVIRRYKRVLTLRRLHAIPSFVWFASSVLMIGAAYESGLGLFMAIGTASLALSVLSLGTILGTMALTRIQLLANYARVMFAVMSAAFTSARTVRKPTRL